MYLDLIKAKNVQCKKVFNRCKLKKRYRFMSLNNTPLSNTVLIMFHFVILKPNSHHLQTILNIPSKKKCLTEHVKRVVFSGDNNSFTRA